MKDPRAIHAKTLTIFLTVLILDQATKYLVRTFLNPLEGKIIIPGFFDLVYVMNKGGAFGLWSDISPLFRGIIFITFSIITICVLLVIYFRSYQETIISMGIAFLIGGALGNLLDRIKFGMVVDFLDFYLGSCHWPAFNIADISICLGLGFLLLDLFVIGERVDLSQKHGEEG